MDIDRAVLRAERLGRLQASMRSHGVDVCLLFNEPNIRYATGASPMPIWSNTTFVRAALVPVEGPPTLFEHGNSVHRSRLVVDDVRPMHAWEFFDDADAEAETWARQMLEALAERGVAGVPVAVDRLGTPGFLALQRAGVTMMDSSAVTRAAREVKTPQEIVAARINGALIVDMLEAFEQALAPGMRERDLVAVLADAMLRGGGEHLSTSTVCSGPNGNPWRSEATDRALEPADLVFVDTDTVGIEGYFSCVSRTFATPGAPVPPERRETYRVAHSWLEAMQALVVPGVTCGELAERGPELPAAWLPQRYECMLHGIGLEEESPSVCYPVDAQSNADRVIEEGMTLVVELYAGAVGGDHGVKLGNQILVTADGPEVLARYPFSADLLA